MHVNTLVSVVKAKAFKGGLSKLYLPTSSATKCWESAALPPLPATRSFFFFPKA